MPYTIADFPDLQREYLLSEGSTWRLLKKDLTQLIEMPSHFDSKSQKKLSTGCNLSLMMVAMGGLEAMATLANIGRASSGTDRVNQFMKNYFPAVNPRWGLCSGDESMIRLVWDAYRNGGLHRFVPKKQKISTSAGDIQFDCGVCWSETPHCLPLKAIRQRWRAIAAGKAKETKHLQFRKNPDGSVNFWVSAPYFTLEFEKAVETWITDLGNDQAKQEGFVNGVSDFESGRAFGQAQSGPGGPQTMLRPWLAQMIESALASSTSA